MNPGDFALIQLYHISDVGDLNDPSTFRTLWNVQPTLDENGDTRFEKIDRGPIFNKRGGTTRDWDPLFRVPIFVATLNEEFGVSVEDILTGRIVEHIKRWMRPIVQRVTESAVEQGKDSVSWTPADMQLERYPSVAGKIEKGMRAFYDNKLVNYAKKFGKKFGAKVGKKEVEHLQDLNPAQQLMAGGEKRSKETSEVWNMPITEKMRKSVLEKGIPLYTAGAVSVGALENLTDDE